MLLVPHVNSFLLLLLSFHVIFIFLCIATILKTFGKIKRKKETRNVRNIKIERVVKEHYRHRTYKIGSKEKSMGNFFMFGCNRN